MTLSLFFFAFPSPTFTEQNYKDYFYTWHVNLLLLFLFYSSDSFGGSDGYGGGGGGPSGLRTNGFFLSVFIMTVRLFIQEFRFLKKIPIHSFIETCMCTHYYYTSESQPGHRGSPHKKLFSRFPAKNIDKE